jgi:ABC-type microcin C transport system duplicated ATPase subunit YejF
MNEPGDPPKEAASMNRVVTSPPLVDARGVSMYFPLADSVLRRVGGKPPDVLKAVDDVSLTIQRGETLGLVGESGCGKSSRRPDVSTSTASTCSLRTAARPASCGSACRWCSRIPTRPSTQR